MTVEEITKEVLPLVNRYRQFPSEKDSVAVNLQQYFSVNSPHLGVIVKDGRFAESFVRKMGKGRMKALKKLLYQVDRSYYQEIDFGF